MNVDIGLLRLMLLAELAKLQKLSYRFYGRLDLLERESWTVPELEGTRHQYVLSGTFDV